MGLFGSGSGDDLEATAIKQKEKNHATEFKKVQTQLDTVIEQRKRRPGQAAQTLLTTGNDPGRNSLLTMKVSK